MSFPRYPAYKDSGVEWLGEVPEHWDVAPLKRGFSVTLGKMLQQDSSGPDDELLPYLRAANIQWDGVDVSDIKQMWLSPRDREQLTLQPGDLLVSEGGDVGRSCMWAGEVDNCSFQNSVNRVRSIDGGSTRFLYYWMSTIKDKGYVDVLCNKSTIAHFTAEKVAAVPVPLPPNEEQRGVAEFLDHETAKIDALVAEQERLIELLKEKRQAVISHAVTKGLDPSVPMKDSGVEWLGEVPAHWIVMPIRLAARLESGHTPSRSRPDWWQDCTVPWFTLADVWQIRDGGADVVYETKELVSELGLANSSARMLPKGTVMLSRTASVGFSAIMGVDMATTQDFANWVCGEKLHPEFLLQVFRSMKGEYRRLMMGSTHNTIYMPDIQAFRFALPPLPEQLRIVGHIKEKASTFDDLISEAVIAVRLLTERRTTLISAAVTGQIDVRGLVSQRMSA